MAELWAGIVRVSHVGGRGGESFHADAEQVAAVEGYAARHGAHVDFMEPELDVSGGLPIEQRPALLRAIEGVEAGHYTGIVVAYLSRLTRSRSGQAIWDRVEAVGGHVHCVLENIDTSTTQGRYVRDMHLANAVREREEAADRFEARRRGSVEAGIWMARVAPRGYAKDSATRRLVPSADAETVRQAFVDRAQGASVQALAERLGMTESGARNLFRNRAYLGELKVGRHVNAAAHPPLVTQAQFDAAQGDRVPQPARGIRHDLGLLSGLVRCRTCGHRLTRDRSGGFYYCKKRHAGAVCPAGAAVKITRLDEHVTAIALGFLAGERVRGQRRAAENTDVIDELDAARAELDTFQRITSAAKDPALFAAGLQQRVAAVDELEAKLRRANAAAPVLAIPARRTLADEWASYTTAQKRTILGGLLEVVVVAPSGRAGRWAKMDDRVRVIAGGANYAVPRRRGEVPMGIQPMEWPDLDDPRVIRLPLD